MRVWGLSPNSEEPSRPSSLQQTEDGIAQYFSDTSIAVNKMSMEAVNIPLLQMTSWKEKMKLSQGAAEPERQLQSQQLPAPLLPPRAWQELWRPCCVQRVKVGLLTKVTGRRDNCFRGTQAQSSTQPSHLSCRDSLVCTYYDDYRPSLQNHN